MPSARSFFDRYVAGERRAVWEELIGLGERVRESRHLSDAKAVASETVRRAKHNVELIYARLVDLGYEFANPDAAFITAGPDSAERIAGIERRLGTLPLLARA